MSAADSDPWLGLISFQSGMVGVKIEHESFVKKLSSFGFVVPSALHERHWDAREQLSRELKELIIPALREGTTIGFYSTGQRESEETATQILGWSSTVELEGAENVSSSPAPIHLWMNLRGEATWTSMTMIALPRRVSGGALLPTPNRSDSFPEGVNNLIHFAEVLRTQLMDAAPDPDKSSFQRKFAVWAWLLVLAHKHGVLTVLEGGELTAAPEDLRKYHAIFGKPGVISTLFLNTLVAAPDTNPTST